MQEDDVPPGAPVNQPTDLHAESSSAAWVIEQLEIEAGQPSDRSRIRRAVDESFNAWPGDPATRWWRWVAESGESLGLRSRPVDCTMEQLFEIAQEGGRLIIRLPSSGDWYGIAANKGRKVLLVHPLSSTTRQWLTYRQLRRELQLNSDRDICRCIVLEPQLSGKLAIEEHAEHPSPLARAWGLLSPERGDINIVILFALVSGILALATPLAIEALVSTVTFGRMLQPVVILSLLLFVFLAFQAAIRGLQTYVAELIQRRLIARVAMDLSYRLPRARMEPVEGHSMRELVNRFFDIVTVQKVTSSFLLDGISVTVNTLVGMAVLGFYHPWLLGFDIVLIGAIAFVTLVLGRGAVATSIKESKCKYQMQAWLEDLADCPVAFRYDGASQFALGRTDRHVYEYLTARRKHFGILLRQILTALGIQALASTTLLGLGGWLVISGQLTLGQLVAAELIVTVIVGSFAKLGKHMESYYDLMASVDKLGYLFDLKMERQDGLLTIQSQRPAQCEVRGLVYPLPSGRNVLDGVNLVIGSGERIALTGVSGSGKSVLFDLLYGLRTPERGHVQIDGIDPRELRPDTLRRAVMLVRKIELFEGTIAENVHLERPEVSSAEVRSALEEVGLLNDILALPDGLHTSINSTGHPLSLNQQRQLMLARAIAGRPTLLLIDGLIDALPDREGEEILARICDPTQPWTLILITGRSRFEKYVNRVIRLERSGPDALGPSLDYVEATHG
ncbi:MAG: ATP-binding cassette domain-containing protein [Planctomycetaceae bacterium]